MKSYPPDVVVLDTDSLLHARFSRGRTGPRIAQAKSFRIAAETFAPSVVTPELVNDAAFAETLRRLRMETGRWDKVSLLLPDSWFRMNILELQGFNERAADAPQVVRWSLKRTLPIPPEDLRIAYSVISQTGTQTKVLVVSAVEKTVAKIEAAFLNAGIDVVLIEPLGLNLWNAIAVRQNGATGDRLFVFVRDREFTTAVFRGAQPLFLRSRNLSADRSLQQELRLSASYLRESLRTETFEECFLAGTSGAEAAAALTAEFAAPVKTVALRDFVEQSSDITGYDAELTACAGVFTG